MSMEVTRQQRWAAAIQPAFNLAARLESNPPTRLLGVAIAAVALTGSLTTLTYQESDNIDLAVADLSGACSDDGCDLEVFAGPALPLTVTIAPTTTVVEMPATTPETVPAIGRAQNEPLRPTLEGSIQQVPTLPELGAMFPGSYGDWQRQLDYIYSLDQQTQVTVEDYTTFQFDDRYMGAFAGAGEYDKRITPKLIVPHWTVHRYPAGPEGGARFVTGLLNSSHGQLSSNYFIDHDGQTVYRYYDEDTRQTAGALGMNNFAVNVELEAGLAAPGDTAPTVLYDVTPEALNKMVITVVQLARRYNLAISEYTIVSHLAGDMIFVNDSFNAENGAVESMRKFDMPQELVVVIIGKAQTLDAQLG